MKKLKLCLIILIISFHASGKNFYFSAIGNDAAAGSILAPYKTIAKFNSIFSSLNPGDSVLFKRNEIFYGSLLPNKSGTTTKPIIIGAYGVGNKPIITGMQTLSNWVNIGGGKYESYNAALGTAINIVTLNDVEQDMGRLPNKDAANGGYNTFETHSGNSSITDVQFIGTTNYTNAELVIRTNRYIIDRAKITNHAGTTINYSPALSYEPINGFGFFIQNDIRTLDQLGEWFYNPGTKKLTVYFGTVTPIGNTVRASTITNVIYLYDVDNIVLDNLSITGGNSYTVQIYSAANIKIQNCDIVFSGIDGILAGNVTGLRIENSTVNYSNNTGINISNGVNTIIRNNRIINTGMIKGLGQNTANKSLGIRETGNHNLIEYNMVDSSGYMGIRFGGDYTTVKNNLVNYFNLTKDDGGGIYTSDVGSGRKIVGNIILNGIGAAPGTNSTTASSTSGIYIDDFTNYVEITGNTIANCNKSGIFLHNAHEITINGNTVYNNSGQQLLLSHNMARTNSTPIRNVIAKNNIFFAKKPDQGVYQMLTAKNDVSLTAGTMDSNYFCRPLDDSYVFKTQYVNAAGITLLQDLDLALWKATYNKDANSKKTSAPIKAYKINSLIGANKFSNGNFGSNINGINISSAGMIIKKWNGTKIDAGTLEIKITSTKPGLTTATIPIGAVVAGRKYIVGFSVQNSKDTMMYVYARQASAPYKVLSNGGVKTILKITPERKEYEMAFSPTVGNLLTSIFFENPAMNATWWLDNIRIYEANVTMTNPDDSIRFEYNASQSAKIISLPGPYVDVKGIAYTSVTLQPYTSAILIKKGTTIIINQGPTVNLTSPENNSQTTNPTPVILSANANDLDGSVTKVEFYDGNSIILTEFNAPYIMAWQNPPSGNHTITAMAYDNVGKSTVSAPVTITINDAPMVIIQLHLLNIVKK